MERTGRWILDQQENDEKVIFLQAMRKESPEARRVFLDEACGEDNALRARVEKLVRLSIGGDSFLGCAAAKLAHDAAEALQAVSDPSSEGPGAVIGPYRLMEQIGEGGFGLVFVAEQQEPVRRRVALKLIKLGMDSREVVNRFEAERQALALMDHPNIARVLDAGTSGSGRPYFVMELVRGIPITEYCDQNLLSPSERLELFVPVCRAIQHAHQKGIIHRDVKPTNVLVTLHDAEPVVKVIDFGVAKALNQQLTQKTVYTKFAQMVGTPLYMSPEQAEMSGLDVDTRSDIYSLGVLLYELLTGSTPFDRERLAKAAFDEVRRIIREEDPPTPSTRLSKSGDRLPSLAAQRKMEPAKLPKVIRGELDWIVMKALEKDRNRRYETANGFAADILRYLSDDTVEACPPTAAYRLRKLARRNRTLLVTSAAVAAALIVGTIVSVWQAVQAREAERRADLLADNAQAQTIVARKEADRAAASERKLIASESKLRERVYASDMNVAGEAYGDGKIDRMNDLLQSHMSVSHNDDQRGIEWYHWWRAGHLERQAARHPRQAAFGQLAISPDGQTIAVGGWPRHTFLYDTNTMALRRSPLQIGGENTPMYFSPDGEFLVVGGEWNTKGPRVLATDSWEVVATLETGRDAVAAFARRKPLLAVGGWDDIHLWSWSNSSWESQGRWASRGKVEQLAMAPEGDVLIARLISDWELNTRIDVWDVAARKTLRTINDGRKHDDIALSSDGSLLAVAERDGTVRLWSIEALVDPDLPASTRTLSASARITSLAFSPDSTWLGAGTENKTLVVWKIQGADQAPLTIRAHSHMIRDIGFDTGSNTLYSTSTDGYLKAWDLTDCQHYDSIRGVDPKSQVGYADDNTLIVNGQLGTIQRWDIRARAWSTPLDKLTRYKRIALSDDGEFLAGVTHHDELRILNVTTGSVVNKTTVDAESECQIVVTRSGRRVAYTVKGRQIQDRGRFGHTSIIHFEHDIRKTNDNRFLNRLSFAPQAFSPDGNQLLVQRIGSTRHSSHLLDVATDPIEQKFQLDGWGPETCAAFSHDGSLLAIGSWNHDIRIHDAVTGQLKHTLAGHAGPPLCLAFSRDGRRLVSAGSDATVRIWMIGESTCRLLSTLRGHDAPIVSVAFSPENTSIASIDDAGVLLVWRTVPVDEVNQNVDWRLARATTIKELNEVQQIAPDDVRVLMRRGQRHLAAGEWDPAIADFGRALELDKDNQYCLQLRAEARVQAGKLVAALDDWTRLVKLSGGRNVDYLSRRGECFLLQERRDEASADFLRALVLGANGQGEVAPSFRRMQSSLLMSRQIVPNGTAWRYSTSRPTDGWQLPDRDDTSWALGAAPFGTGISAKTIWSNASDIWLRRTFRLDQEVESPLVFRVLSDDVADIYLNGILAARVNSSTDNYQTVACSPEARLRIGENAIAVHCRDEGSEASVIDVGLYVQGDPTAFRELLGEAVKQRPDVWFAWCWQLVEQQRWKEAAAAYGELVELYPADSLVRLRAAILYAYTENFDRFHQLTSESHQRFATTDVVIDAERIAKACLVAPPREAELTGASALIDRVLSVEPESDGFVPWALVTKAMSDYRRGNYQAAIDWAEKSRDHALGHQPPCEALALGVLAMAHAQLPGRTGALNYESELQQHLEKYSLVHTGAKPDSVWHDWLIGELFLREVRRELVKNNN